MKDCIGRAHDQGAISKQDAEFLRKKFDDYVNQGQTPAEAQASVIAFLQSVAKEKERRALLVEDVRKKIETRIFSHKNRKGEQDIAGGWSAFHDELDKERDVVLSRWLRDADEIMLFFEKGIIRGDKRRQSAKFGDTQVKTVMSNMVREIRGEKTNDEMAARFAQMFSAMFEKSRQEFNGLGGLVGKLENWFPQSHNADEVRRIGRGKWVEMHMDKQLNLLDREKMLHPLTGKIMTDGELKEALEYAWESITSAGWFDREVTSQPVGKGALYKQHADHRFLHYTTDGWLKYVKDYGNPDPYNAAMGHLAIMARDVAALKRLGPNPELMRNYIKNLITKRINTTDTIRSIHAENVEEVRRALLVVSGHVEAARAPLYQLIDDTLEEIRGLRDKKRDLESRIQFARRAERKAEFAEEINVLELKRADLRKELSSIQKLIDNIFDSVETTTAVIAARERIRDINLAWVSDIDVPSGNWQGKAGRAVADADDMWDSYRGLHGIPRDQRLADTFGSLRNLQVATKLGSASVSSLVDVLSNKMGRAFAGMDRNGVHDIVGGIVSMFSKDNKAEAIRGQLMFSHMLSGIQQNARWAIAQSSVAGTGFLAERTLALSGMTGWTENAKAAWGLDFMAFMGDHAKTKFSDLPNEVRRTLERGTFTALEWDKIRRADQHKGRWDASGILRPREIEAAAGQDLADKYLLMLLKERGLNIIEPTLYMRAKLAQGTQRGTWGGELLRSGLQFKSFGLTYLHLHVGRIMDEAQAGRPWSAASYTAQLIVGGMIIGAVVMQLKELISGRDPRPMDRWNFWGGALIQSGGLGIYGDFLASSQNRFGGGALGTAAGPLAGDAIKLLEITSGNAGQWSRGEKTNAGREVVDFVGRQVPVVSSHLLTKTAYDRIIMGTAHRMLDPEAYGAVNRRMMTNRRRDYGNEFFWQPGQYSPSRLPDPSSALGGR